ncbi:MAG: type II toxin-antitoxin system prevent-host-death family antitoxin [Rhodospirillaceae bacterium]|nr:type II toxin-antitoxin system prevent-host-death family antitoxin [Rhodospirillaceae bacterium]
MGTQKRMTASEANRNFSGVLRRVKGGEEIIVTSHGQPVAKISPVDDADNQKRMRAWAKLMARLERQPVKIIGRWTREEIHERKPWK